LDEDLQLACRRNPLLGLLIPVWGQVQDKVDLSSTLLALLELQCRAAAGEEVAPMGDPFAPGQPLRKRGKVFYSVGPDRQDDGGEPLAPRYFSDPEQRGDISLLSWFKPSIEGTSP